MNRLSFLLREDQLHIRRFIKLIFLAVLFLLITLACSLNLSSSNEGQVKTGVVETENAQREMELAVTATLMAQQADEEGAGKSTSTPTPIPSSPTPRPPTPTATQTARKGVTIDFDALPDGTVIGEDRLLEGDEFGSQGVLLAGYPVSDYCEEAKSTAIEVPPYFTGIPFEHNYLTATKADDLFTCASIPVQIDFVEPVRKVDIEFIGCEEKYQLRAFSESGEPLGNVMERGYLDQHSTVEYSSVSANIDYVTFGRELCGTFIKQIHFQR